MKDQVTQVGVLDYLRDIKNNRARIRSLKPALQYIDLFLRTIKSANKEDTYNLVDGLVKNLKRVEITINCFKLKTDTLREIHLPCKEGTKSLKKVFDAVVEAKGTNEGVCTTVVNYFSSFFCLSFTLLEPEFFFKDSCRTLGIFLACGSLFSTNSVL